MSLYNMLHGVNTNAAAIIRSLDLELSKIDRFRDASFVKDGDSYVFRLLCRTGGGNRATWPNTQLTSHPLYLRDHDDDFDNTYAYYYFRIPQETLDELAAAKLSINDMTDDETLEQKTKRAIKELEGGN